MAVVALFGALVLGAVLSACAVPVASRVGPTDYDDAIDLGVPGALVETVEGVPGYPACGTEPISHGGITWYPFIPENVEQFPEVVAMPLRVGGLGGGTSRLALPGVVAPGPGDDVGTLAIYEGGFAFWRSDSGDLSTWLTDRPLEYPWVC